MDSCCTWWWQRTEKEEEEEEGCRTAAAFKVSVEVQEVWYEVQQYRRLSLCVLEKLQYQCPGQEASS